MNPVNEQYELYENAKSRVKQKKRLYYHFILFLIGSVFFIVLNKVLGIGEDFLNDWFVWAILIWLFLLAMHTANVFIFKRFMDKDWEREQTEKLVLKQELKITKMEKELAEIANLKSEK